MFVLAAAAGDLIAAASDWNRTDVSEVRLIAAQDAVGDGSVSLGLQIRLVPGWKTYWRSPGEAGFPPRIDWSGSINLASAKMFWPAPQRFLEIGDLWTHGYKDEVVFPLTIRAEDPNRPLVLQALVDYPACEEVCYPFQAELSLELPTGAGRPSTLGGLVARFLARVPGPPMPGGLAIRSAEASGSGADQVLHVTATSRLGFSAPELFVEGPYAFYFGAPTVAVNGDEVVFRMTAPAPRDGTTLVGAALSFTVVDGDSLVEQVATVVPGTAEAFSLVGMAVILALAFAGGLILNLMPCVLPVLSLKVMAAIGHGGAERRGVALNFAAAATGIVASFLVLAAAVAGAKSAGMAVGWGVQFQEPLFLVALVVVITLFACNLVDLFHIPLPAWLGGAASAGGHGGMAGHFASGAFATLLATPCSAPFLGTAVGFALARGTGEIFAVFAALGLGMAAPFVTIAVAPGLATSLPLPGPWMVTLRRVLALLLAGTALWLLTVLATQSGTRVAIAVGALMVATAMALAYGASGDRSRRVAVRGLLVSTLALAFVVPSYFSRPAMNAPAADALWRDFDRDAIPGLIAAGKTVFVDVTADWCVTCKFNKVTVLERGETARRLAQDNVVAVRADWTSPDPAIAAYLEDFGRYGIPFDAVYGPALPRGLVLPELLTEDAVISALDRAGLVVSSDD
ncbi:MAG: protein-disulfide reductase DsbD domain-containing protein [Pseudomonadota bacterium]|nr:protein-disulfide reductase DsbD domain-containing protein [Pseudomonadota bacterium]